jgi:hypothetical protein
MGKPKPTLCSDGKHQSVSTVDSIYYNTNNRTFLVDKWWPSIPPEPPFFSLSRTQNRRSASLKASSFILSTSRTMVLASEWKPLLFETELWPPLVASLYFLSAVLPADLIASVVDLAALERVSESVIAGFNRDECI